MKSDWTKRISTVILYALSAYTVIFQADGAEEKKASAVEAKVELTQESVKLNAAEDKIKDLQVKLDALSTENKLISSELIKILEKYRELEGDYRRLQLSVVASALEGEKTLIGRKEAELLADVKKLSEAAKSSAIQTLRFCDEIDRGALDKLSDKVEAAKFRIKEDELRESAEKLLQLTATAENTAPPKQCRILAVNADLKVVVLPVGYTHRIRQGMQWYGDSKSEIKLVVVAVRQSICAALLVSGDINNLAPGMTLYSRLEKDNTN